MKATSKTKEQDGIISDRSIRDKCVGHYEVLERVKELLLLPGTDFATMKQVAEYYEVEEKAIEKVCLRNFDELELDGVSVKKLAELSFRQSVGLKTGKGKTTLTFADGTEYDYPTRGTKMFPRRAILRIGMLLRDSEVAKEIRTQLLNIEEKTSNDVKIVDINEEQKLMLDVGMAVASGDANAVAIASTNLIAFKNRHIKQLENDNKGLAGQILEWSDRKKLNAGIRQLAAVTGIPFGNMWNELYKNLQYKYGICLKQRGGTPYLQWIKESEWESVIKTFCAMCETYEQSPTEMFQQTTPTNALASVN